MRGYQVDEQVQMRLGMKTRTREDKTRVMKEETAVAMGMQEQNQIHCDKVLPFDVRGKE
jgi:hypothetical protein